MMKLLDVHTYYDESYILQGISFKIDDGSVVTMLGRNGMGKTTTIHTIMGFTTPRRGLIKFNGEKINGLKPYEIAVKGIGLVPQGREIFPSLSVEENLKIAAREGRGKAKWSLDRIHALFPILKERARFKGNLLSGGEQQMLCIGRALMTNPTLLLMDEPSEGLAPIIVQEIENIIRQLKMTGHSIFLVEQNLSMALSLADYVYVISKGKIVYEAIPEIFNQDEVSKSKYLGVV
jgi:branched-chain amino acid transport system ATP-binding protein